MRLIPGGASFVAPGVAETTYLELVGANGSVIPLTDAANGTVVMPGVQGLGNLPYSLLLEEMPGTDGATLKGVRSPARDIFIPIYLEGATRDNVVAQIAYLANAVDPRRGLSTLRVLRPTGAGRQIGVLYAGGMEGDDGLDAAGLHWATYGLAFKAPDPAFRDLVDVYFRWTVGVDAPFFPILPLTLTESQILGTNLPLTNAGDEVAYPRWRISGPATSIAITNVTTSKSWSITRTQTVGQWLDVDTRPGVRTVLDQGGTNLWPALAADPNLWSLEPGINVVTFTIGGATSSTYAEMWYTPRYKTAE